MKVSTLQIDMQVLHCKMSSEEKWNIMKVRNPLIWDRAWLKLSAMLGFSKSFTEEGEDLKVGSWKLMTIANRNLNRNIAIK